MLETHIINRYANACFIFLILILTLVHFYQRNLLSYTGDEPRFAYYSYSIVKGEMLKFPVEQFVQDTKSVIPAHNVSSLPLTMSMFNTNMFMMNSILPPLMYSPALFFGKAYKSWELLRTAAFLYYCAALIFIWISLRSIFTNAQAFFALTISTLAAPRLVQMSLGNTEQAAIFFLSSALYFLFFRRISTVSILIGTLSLCLVVFASMRCGSIVMPLAIGYLIRLWKISTDNKYERIKKIVIFLTVSILGGLAWIVFQRSFTGTIIGSSLLNETLADKSVLWFLHRLMVPLLNHKDGIFLLFPLIFTSLLGLLNAAKRGSLVAGACLLSWCSYYFLLSLTSQSEGYPGRLHFVLIEFFIIGLAFYIRDFRNIAARIILVIGFIFSSIVIYIHLKNPDLLIMNRQFGLFQQFILEKTQWIDLGRYIIWDEHSIWTTINTPLFLSEVWLVSSKVCMFLLIVGILLLLSISKQAKVNKFCSFSALVVVLLGFFSITVKPVSFNVNRICGIDQCSLNLNFNQPIKNNVTITFGTEPFWQPPEYPSYFTVIVKMKNGNIKQYQKRSMPEIRLVSRYPISSITIFADKTKIPWSAHTVKVYSSLV